jgi:hypothetical protein
LRFRSDPPALTSYLFGDSVIEETGTIFESSEIESCLYERSEDNSLIIVKSIFVTEFIGDGLIDTEIEN